MINIIPMHTILVEFCQMFFKFEKIFETSVSLYARPIFLTFLIYCRKKDQKIGRSKKLRLVYGKGIPLGIPRKMPHGMG